MKTRTYFMFVMGLLILSFVYANTISLTIKDGESKTIKIGNNVYEIKINGILVDNNGNYLVMTQILEDGKVLYQKSKIVPYEFSYGNFNVSVRSVSISSGVGYVDLDVISNEDVSEYVEENNVNTTTNENETENTKNNNKENFRLNSYIKLIDGEINGKTIDPSNPQIVVSPGEDISGRVTIEVKNSGESSWIFPVIATPSWGDHKTSYWIIASHQNPGVKTYNVNINLKAPDKPGEYYIIFVANWELDGGDVASATNWRVGEEHWNDGNDVADWSSEIIDEAIKNGLVLVDWEYLNGIEKSYVPATAIKVIVKSSETTNYSSLVSGKEKTIFFDDFESYSVGTFPSSGGWEILYNGAGDEQQYISDKYSKSGEKSFRLLGRTGWSAVVIRRFNSSAPIIGFEFDILFSGKGSNYADHPGFVCTWSRPWSQYWDVTFDHSDSTIFIKDINGNKVVLGKWEPKTWYHIKAIINRNTKTMSVWINGVLKADNIKLPKDYWNTEDIEGLALTSAWPAQEVFYDNVRVFEVTSKQEKDERQEIINYFPLVDNEGVSGYDTLDSAVKVHTLYNNTFVFIDLNYNGKYDDGEPSQYINTDKWYEFRNLPDNKLIKLIADKPIVSYYWHWSNNWGLYDDDRFDYSNCIPGNEFIVPRNGKVCIGSLEDENNIKVDDKTYSLNKGEILKLDVNKGTIIKSDKPIVAVLYNVNKSNYDSSWAVTLIPTNYFGTEFIIPKKPVEAFSQFKDIKSNEQKIYITYSDGTVEVKEAPDNIEKWTTKKPAMMYYFFDIYSKDPWALSYRHYMCAFKILPVSLLPNEYIGAFSIISPYNGNEIKIDSNYDGIYDKTITLNENEGYNLPKVRDPPHYGYGADFLGYVVGKYPIMSYTIGIGSWNGVCENIGAFAIIENIPEIKTINNYTIKTIKTINITKETKNITKKEVQINFTAETKIEKVIVEELNKSGYLIEHKINITNVTINTDKEVILRTIMNISKKVAYSTDEMLLPKGTIIIQREPVIALDIKDPKEGEKITQQVIILSDAPESEVIKGIKIEHKVIVKKSSSLIYLIVGVILVAGILGIITKKWWMKNENKESNEESNEKSEE
jgi:hypothetical protein